MSKGDIAYIASVHSEYGLRKSVSETEERIKQKEKEHVDTPVRYNPLMTDGIRAEIDKDLVVLRADLVVFEAALVLKLSEQSESTLVDEDRNETEVALNAPEK